MNPKEENVVNVSDVQYWSEILFCNKILFRPVHENVGILGNKSGRHGCSTCLNEELIVKGKDIVVEDETDELRISIRDGHLSRSLYHKPTDNLTMLHFSSFHPKHVKKSIPYGQTLCIHRICSDEEERDRHLKVLKDALTGTGYDAQLIDRQFRHVTAKNHNDLLRRQTKD
eukprot:g23952.t1